MKIREGFVSNSSSSSFVVKKNQEFKTVKDLTLFMMNRLDYGLDRIPKVEKSIKDPNTPVIFDSCNYDTYIVSLNDYFLVNTCNNEDWGVDEMCESFAKINQLYPNLDASWDHIDLESLNPEYWHIDYNLMVQETGKYCNTHFEKMFIIHGKIDCPICFKEQHKDREEKLKRLLNDENESL